LYALCFLRQDSAPTGQARMHPPQSRQSTAQTRPFSTAYAGQALSHARQETHAEFTRTRNKLTREMSESHAPRGQKSRQNGRNKTIESTTNNPLIPRVSGNPPNVKNALNGVVPLQARKPVAATRTTKYVRIPYGTKRRNRIHRSGIVRRRRLT